MKLTDIKGLFNEGKISKWEYIDEMYAIHDHLFQYGRFIKDTNISTIEITDDHVIMTFRDSGIRFICVENDRRLAPLDTLNFGSYEASELAIQRKLCGEKGIVFDIGANFGWYALHMAKDRPDIQVHSFEPFINTFNYLTKNIALNSAENIIGHHFGFSDTAGEKDFFVNPALSVNASLVNVAGTAEAVKVTCNFQTVDQHCYEQEIFPDFIKCDVEGAELLVFNGARKLLNEKKPIVFTEMLRKWTAGFGYHPNDIIALFKDAGYLCYAIQETGAEPITEVTEETKETNFIFLHPVQHSGKITLLKQ